MAKDNGYDGILDKYEALCARCVELRQSAASGVDVSREEVQKAIDDFVDSKIGVTYIVIDPLFKDCEFNKKGWATKFRE